MLTNDTLLYIFQARMSPKLYLRINHLSKHFNDSTINLKVQILKIFSLKTDHTLKLKIIETVLFLKERINQIRCGAKCFFRIFIFMFQIL